MSAPGPGLAADLLLAVLGDERWRGPRDHRDWPLVGRVAASNAVLLRTIGALGPTELPEAVAETVRRERARTDAMLGVMESVTRACAALGIAAVYPKALQFYPDMGRDIDLLLGSASRRDSDRLRRALGGTGSRGSPSDRLAGRAAFQLPGCPVILDVEHARLGLAGEQTELAMTLIRAARQAPVTGRLLPVPTEELQMVVQGLERTTGRRTLRLADVAWSIARARDPGFDWEQVTSACRRYGLEGGLSCYLSYLDQIHRQACGSPLPCPPPVRALVRSRWGRVVFQGDRYRFPALAATGRLLLQGIVHQASSRHWGRAARLALVPGGVASAAALRQVSRLMGARPRPATAVGVTAS